MTSSSLVQYEIEKVESIFSKTSDPVSVRYASRP